MRVALPNKDPSRTGSPSWEPSRPRTESAPGAYKWEAGQSREVKGGAGAEPVLRQPVLASSACREVNDPLPSAAERTSKAAPEASQRRQAAATSLARRKLPTGRDQQSHRHFLRSTMGYRNLKKNSGDNPIEPDRAAERRESGPGDRPNRPPRGVIHECDAWLSGPEQK